MAVSSLSRMLWHLRRATLRQADSLPADHELLEGFVSGRDEAAFEALLRRHGPMTD
jgi:hypothetical protein